VAFDKLYRCKTPITAADLGSLQADPDEWLIYYNQECAHLGKMCWGRSRGPHWRMGRRSGGRRNWLEPDL